MILVCERHLPCVRLANAPRRGTHPPSRSTYFDGHCYRWDSTSAATSWGCDPEHQRGGAGRKWSGRPTGACRPSTRVETSRERVASLKAPVQDVGGEFRVGNDRRSVWTNLVGLIENPHFSLSAVTLRAEPVQSPSPQTAMSIAGTCSLNFDQEMAATRRLLERGACGERSWKPHPKSFALGHARAQLVLGSPAGLRHRARAPTRPRDRSKYSFEQPRRCFGSRYQRPCAREALAGF